MTTTCEGPPRDVTASSEGPTGTHQPPQKGATVSAAYPIPRQINLDDLERDGVTVLVDLEFGDRRQCNHCANVDALASVRVYGEPAPRIVAPIRLAEVCRTCAPAVIGEALAQQDEWSRKPIAVEVAL